MRKFLTCILALTSLVSCSEDSDSPDYIYDDLSGLHPRAQYFIQLYFDDYRYTGISVMNEPGENGKLYEVVLDGKISIDFDYDGYWLVMNGNLLPYSVVDIFPETMKNYLTRNSYQKSIKTIQRYIYGYKMDFSGRSSLAFDTKGGLLGYDKGIQKNILPGDAVSLLDGYFADFSISYIIENVDNGNFTVKLSGPYTILFEEEGNWISVSGDTYTDYIPEDLFHGIHPDLYEYIQVNHPGFGVVYIGLMDDNYYYLILENNGEIRTAHIIISGE